MTTRRNGLSVLASGICVSWLYGSPRGGAANCHARDCTPPASPSLSHRWRFKVEGEGAPARDTETLCHQLMY